MVSNTTGSFICLQL